ncbi:MAG: hypothetical protein H6510_12680 [Acidobacteria bacterium]|nr:hypothetical protein [Acidobacteriota bacterium]MCB9398662.1 hypothetical protein [Acidobacteriota bacterium]
MNGFWLILLVWMAGQDPVQEEVQVVVQSWRVRALDGRGLAVTDLKTADFLAQCQSQDLEIQHCEFLASKQAALDPVPIRLVVQSDFSGQRWSDLMRASRQIDQFLAKMPERQAFRLYGLNASARDWGEFADKTALRDPLQSLLTRHAHAERFPEVASNASGLIRYLAEQAQPSETILWLGWGLSDGKLNDRYELAETLQKKGIALIVLDLTDAWHTLQIDLEMVATGSGGAYFATHPNFGSALDGLGQFVGGSYLIRLEAGCDQPRWRCRRPGVHLIAQRQPLP